MSGDDLMPRIAEGIVDKTDMTFAQFLKLDGRISGIKIGRISGIRPNSYLSVSSLIETRGISFVLYALKI